jgi:hypothetical protein
MSTPSTTRSLADIATPDGIFSIIAMDQRNTLRRMFSAIGIDATDDDLVAAKADVARALTPLAAASCSIRRTACPQPRAPGRSPRRADCWWRLNRPSAADSGWSRSRVATRRLIHTGSCRRAATPTSSSPSCGPTARHLPPASRISSHSACRRWARSSPTVGTSASRRLSRTLCIRSRAKISPAVAVKTPSSRRRARSTKSTVTY